MARTHLHAEDERSTQPAAARATTDDAGARMEPEHLARVATSVRGGDRSADRTIGALQRHAGNAAVVQMLATPSSRSAPSVQRDDDDETADGASPQASPGPATTDAGSVTADAGTPTADAATATGDDGATKLDDDAGTPDPNAGKSYTKVGPPTPANYTVTGTLRDAANGVAAGDEAGSVTTTPDLVTDPPASAGGKVPSARVTVTQALKLPEWSGRTGPDKGSPTGNQVAEWNRFSTAISKHEAGHIAKDKAAFADAHTKIAGKTETDGTTAWNTITAKADKDNADYDTANDHGRKEGTTINPNIDEVTKVP